MAPKVAGSSPVTHPSATDAARLGYEAGRSRWRHRTTSADTPPPGWLRSAEKKVECRLAFGPLAQLVEQGTLNPKVIGSIPIRPTIDHVEPVPIRGPASYVANLGMCPLAPTSPSRIELNPPLAGSGGGRV